MALGQFSPADIAIDMGTDRTRIYVRGKGIVVNEASIVAMDSGKNGRIVAIGDGAEEVAGRSDNRIRVLHPVQQGKITDLETEISDNEFYGCSNYPNCHYLQNID